MLQKIHVEYSVVPLVLGPLSSVTHYFCLPIMWADGSLKFHPSPCPIPPWGQGDGWHFRLGWWLLQYFCQAILWVFQESPKPACHTFQCAKFEVLKKINFWHPVVWQLLLLKCLPKFSQVFSKAFCELVMVPIPGLFVIPAFGRVAHIP